MKKLETFKNVVKIAAGIGVSTIVNCIVDNNTSEEEGTLKKVAIWFGGLILAGMVCDKVSTYIGEKFDEVENASKEAVKEPKQETA